MDGQHSSVDWILTGQDTLGHRRQRQMETTRSWCGQASERGRLKARQGSHQCQTNTRTTMVIGVRHTGQPAASSATLLAQHSQKRACPHGTRANTCRGSTRHTSQQSSGAAAATCVGFRGALLCRDRRSNLLLSKDRRSKAEHVSHTRPSLSSPAISVPFDYDGSDRNYDSTAIRLRRIARACFHSTRFDARKKLPCQFFVVVVS